MHILLSRTDSIGDVVLTLPLAGIIKEKYPNATISFIGRSYTEAVINLSRHVDNFINWDKIEVLKPLERIKTLKDLNSDWIIHVFPNKKLCRDAKKAGIENRVGTSHRTFHWATCNKLVSFSRKKSDLHEAQLNCKLLSPLGINVPDLDEFHANYGFREPDKGAGKIRSLLDKNCKNIVLHPKSKGSAREWGLENFGQLIKLLPNDKFKLFITGTVEERVLVDGLLNDNKEHVIDLTGQFNLEEFITFLSMADAIVAASTGPLHIAAAVGTMALGIYPPIRPMHPGRWAPIGKKAEALVKNVQVCNECRKTLDCHCIREITPEQVVGKLMQLYSD